MRETGFYAAYFRDPDGTVLEYIDLTSYSGAGG